MNWDYLAGWFDADGTLFWANNAVKILFQNTDERVILAIREFLGLERLKVSRRDFKKKNRKTIFYLQVTKRSDCIRIMKELEKRCITKRDKILEMGDKYNEWEKEKWEKRMKHKRPKKPNVLYV